MRIGPSWASAGAATRPTSASAAMMRLKPARLMGVPPDRFVSAFGWRVRRPEPERRRLADPLEVGAALGRAARVPDGEVVGVQHVVSRLRAEEPGQLGEPDE